MNNLDEQKQFNIQLESLLEDGNYLDTIHKCIDVKDELLTITILTLQPYTDKDPLLKELCANLEIRQQRL